MEKEKGVAVAVVCAGTMFGRVAQIIAERNIEIVVADAPTEVENLSDLPYNGNVSHYYPRQIEPMDIAHLNDYKSGKEQRRERRKQERKTKLKR